MAVEAYLVLRGGITQGSSSVQAEIIPGVHKFDALRPTGCSVLSRFNCVGFAVRKSCLDDLAS